jgi:hypothetical protein
VKDRRKTTRTDVTKLLVYQRPATDDTLGVIRPGVRAVAVEQLPDVLAKAMAARRSRFT